MPCGCVENSCDLVELVSQESPTDVNSRLGLWAAPYSDGVTRSTGTDTVAFGTGGVAHDSAPLVLIFNSTSEVELVERLTTVN